ncbi:hypothetical protein B0I37DRAFT_371882 [Chaetomium sp. MPI-CAGE-AT-0009]|nr:hypothetical protein B0I37DRAFT_371882 [Chaetomium sp. MPI-CAGE-AT-0009]
MASHTTGFGVVGSAGVVERDDDSMVESTLADTLAPLSPSSPIRSAKRYQTRHSSGTFHDMLKDPPIDVFEQGWKGTDLNKASTSTAGDWFSEDGRASTAAPGDPLSPRMATVYNQMAIGQQANPSSTSFTPSSPRRMDYSAKLSTINELAAMRNIEDRNKEVGEWLEKSTGMGLEYTAASRWPDDCNEGVPEKETDGLEPTENKYVDGQAYLLNPPKGKVTPLDLEIIATSRVWNDAPVLHAISEPSRARYQPHKSRRTSCKPNLPRFACPYQAFEPGRPCLRRSRRNPKGGSDGLGRLKYEPFTGTRNSMRGDERRESIRQHLARKHMVSYRCPNCWISLDSRAKASLHEQQKHCVARPKPDDERFMDPPHEGLIERSCSSASEEDAWWWLFKLLVPGMQGRDVAALRLEYSPYFIHFDTARAFMLPAITFPDAVFHSTQPIPSSPRNGTEMPHSSPDRSNAAGPPDSNLYLPIPMATTTPELSYDFSQTFSVPLFEAPILPSPSTNDGSSTLSSLQTFPDAMLSSQTSSSPSPAANVNLSVSSPKAGLLNVPVCKPSSSSDSVSMHTAVNTNSMPPPPPPPPQSTSLSTTLGSTIVTTRAPSSTTSSAQPSARETHLQRTNDRLKKRICQLETENEGLRQASQASRADLSRAHALLEEVLGTEGLNLTGELYERLVEAGDLVSSCLHASGRV